MGIGGSLLELGQFLDRCERRGHVDSVDLAEDCSPGATGRMAADVELTFSLHGSGGSSPALSLGGATVDDDGRVRLTLDSVDDVVPDRPDGVELEPAGAAFDADGSVTVTLTATSTVAEEGSTAATAPADGEAPTAEPAGEPVGRGEAPTGPTTEADADGTNRSDEQSGTDDGDEDLAWRNERSVPPFSDPELLEAVYESCDTFAEMPDALGMDVTAETVRRYMIDHGIHEPDSYETAADEGVDGGPQAADTDLASPVVLTDGLGLPEDVTVDGLVDVVQRSNTIYEVTAEMGIDRQEAVDMLEQLDLSEYVAGRLAKAGEREVTRELVLERLQRHAEPT